MRPKRRFLCRFRGARFNDEVHGLKIAHSAFVAVLGPAYWHQYGPGNFLWFSDIALLVVARRGYDRRAFRQQTIVTWLILFASWWLTKPEDNVNWVYSRRGRVRSPAARAGFVRKK